MAITSANENCTQGGCVAGDGNGTDILILEQDSTYALDEITTALDGSTGNVLPVISSSINIEGNNAVEKPSDQTNARIFSLSVAGNLTLTKITLSEGIPRVEDLQSRHSNPLPLHIYSKF